MMHKICYFHMLLLLILTGSPGWAGSAGTPKPVSFVLLHVNDTHSRFTPRPYALQFPGLETPMPVPVGSVSKIAALVRQTREHSPHVLFLHAGDMVQGSLYYTLFHGQAEAHVFNAMGLDAMAAGNHEFDRGTGGILSLLDHAQFPVMSANMDVSDDPDLAGRIPPYIIKQVDGVPVAVIGLLTRDLHRTSSPPDTLRMGPVIQTAQETINRLTAREIRIIILLSHIGYEKDRLLARSVTGADIIVGGHSHTLLGNFQDLGLTPEGSYPTMVTAPDGTDVLVVHAWKHTRLLGRLSVDFDASGKIVSHQGSPCLIAGIPLLDKEEQPLDPRTQERVRLAIERDTRIALPEPDPAVAAIAEMYAAQVAEQGHIVVGRAEQPLPHIRVPDPTIPQGSAIAPLVAESLKRKVNRNGFDVDIAIQNAGGVRTGLRAGDITIETIYTLLPFENTLVIFQMTGQQINALLEDASGAIFDGQQFFGGFPYTSGLRFRIDPAAGKGNRISECRVMDASRNWHPMNSHATYRVVVNSFLAGGGDGYTAFDSLEGHDTGFIDTQAFLEYVSAQKTLDPPDRDPFFQTP
ncbi:MAG: 5'-nucleotidase C-terminal domain-containing protein [Desulfotignum sp.]|nr:5'-nucleotidase C-terminal domain-containing protein [Desulfotignum sp.]MCF8088628.1 5'-nucleotidase C-terminal domain-containing protein [Desulfotignum sp.]MCF8137872.1 5'-nucleotidase C-terminal domain-containing protein [Desulfotignum sp.]